MVEIHLISGHTVHTNASFHLVNKIWEEYWDPEKSNEKSLALSFDDEVENNIYKGVVDLSSIVAITEGAPMTINAETVIKAKLEDKDDKDGKIQD